MVHLKVNGPEPHRTSMWTTFELNWTATMVLVRFSPFRPSTLGLQDWSLTEFLYIECPLWVVWTAQFGTWHGHVDQTFSFLRFYPRPPTLNLTCYFILFANFYPIFSGGLGLISVVLISAILAGSGCHVLKKDTQENINELNTFITNLKGTVRFLCQEFTDSRS